MGRLDRTMAEAGPWEGAWPVKLSTTLRPSVAECVKGGPEEGMSAIFYRSPLDRQLAAVTRCTALSGDSGAMPPLALCVRTPSA